MLTPYYTCITLVHMNTTTTKATDLQLGDMVALRGGGFRKVTGVDITPAVVRVRTGRSQQWMRAKHDATFEVA
jgi:hypothetical protein